MSFKNKWKNLPTWSKGGLIALLPIVLVMIVDFFLTCDFGRGAEFCGFISMMAGIPVFYFFKYIGLDLDDGFLYTSIFLILALYFYVGALAGYLVGRAKGKGSKSGKVLLIIFVLVVALLLLKNYVYISGGDRGPGGKLRVCPDKWESSAGAQIHHIDDISEVTGLLLGPKPIYYKGEKREISDFDLSWIHKNCESEIPI